MLHRVVMNRARVLLKGVSRFTAAHNVICSVVTQAPLLSVAAPGYSSGSGPNHKDRSASEASEVSGVGSWRKMALRKVLPSKQKKWRPYSHFF